MNFDGGRTAIIENREIVIDDVISFFRAINFKGEVSTRQVSSRDFKLTNIKAQLKAGI